MKQGLNPYLPGWEYIPDGEPYVFGERVYIYGSHDRFGSEKFCMNDYVCWSASVENLAEWKYEGIIYRKNQDPSNLDGKRCLYAPDVCIGPDGKYYLYYALDDRGIMSVAVCETPAGQYEYLGDIQYPDGHILGENVGDIYQFDPGIFVDEDKRIWLYTGFGLGDHFQEHFAGRVVDGMYVIELEQDMITIKNGPKRLMKSDIVNVNFKNGNGIHDFFEASSMRKIGSTYYLIYSSRLSNELCYMTSQYPDRDFVYGGTLVSNGDIGYEGRTLEHPLDHLGNTHGSLIQIKEQWYVFYHRHTNHHGFSRQGCAEKIKIAGDGSIAQVERTSCGLNKGSLEGKGIYPAYIACNLFIDNHVGYTGESDYCKDSRPYITQDGGDRETGEDPYITAWRDGGILGYKYFNFKDTTRIQLLVKGTGKGVIEIYTALDANDHPIGKVGTIEVQGICEHQWYSAEVCGLSGEKALFFQYRGDGELMFSSFILE